MPTSIRVLACVLALGSASGCALLTSRSPRPRGWWALSLLLPVGNVIWLAQHRSYEGPIVVDAGGGHGLAVADLGVPPSLAIAAALLVRGLRGER